MTDTRKVLALCGGIGGAKLALGLSRVLDPGQFTVVTNTGDDFHHLGFSISPDLDTVMYTLADRSNQEVGWGLDGETWNFMGALTELGEEHWFRLGDRDLATHVTRTRLLASGETLSRVTAELCRRYSVEHALVPMSDDPVATMVDLQNGEAMPFQHYFVRDRCEPVVRGFHFEGIDTASPSPAFSMMMHDPALSAIVICPSNPFVSIDPILSLQGVREALIKSPVPVIAVSPIVGGQAIKGPTAKMMTELGMPTSAVAVAAYYGQVLDGFILDRADDGAADEIMAMGLATIVTNTVMVSLADRIQLARDTLEMANQLHQPV